MKNSLDILEERGFVQQCSDRSGLQSLLAESTTTYYVGFDPTAESFHIGSLIPIMAMTHLQKAGHKPIAIIGGGTGLIGDPSGKTEMRKILSREDIDSNIKRLSKQFERYLNLKGKDGLILDNADWLVDLKYIDFLREIGKYFKVNEMIKNEGYRIRLEREEGLSFIEFNYQLLQAYDFLVLFDHHHCMLQMGGDDQWGNILAGVDLVRRLRRNTVFALTFPLITTASGQKMGKTESGAVWLDEEKTSPYDFYQYWINCDDRDTIRFLKMFTFLPMEDIKELGNLQGADIRQAKEILAFETTKLCHGNLKAEEAKRASLAVFDKTSTDSSGLPTTWIEKKDLSLGISVIDLFVKSGLAKSKSIARRLIEQGGAYVNDKKVTSVDEMVQESSFTNGVCVIRHGKKQYHRVTLK